MKRTVPEPLPPGDSNEGNRAMYQKLKEGKIDCVETLGQTYVEAQELSMKVEWKTNTCTQGEQCWCRIIEPKDKIIDTDDNEIYIAGSGCVPTIYAEHIVKLHNSSLAGWVALQDGYPDENETVWLYHNVSRFLALGCRFYPQGKEGGWIWALSNGTIYSENRKIVAECEANDDYEFTHWCRLPALP